jgi:hypothetical protein
MKAVRERWWGGKAPVRPNPDMPRGRGYKEFSHMYISDNGKFGKHAPDWIRTEGGILTNSAAHEFSFTGRIVVGVLSIGIEPLLRSANLPWSLGSSRDSLSLEANNNRANDALSFFWLFELAGRIVDRGNLLLNGAVKAVTSGIIWRAMRKSDRTLKK